MKIAIPICFRSNPFYSIFVSILSYSVLLHSHLLCSIYSILFYSNLFHCILYTDVHCASTLCLLSPSLCPWRVRERVWRELGQVRLLHLLENEEIIFSMLGILYCSSIVTHHLHPAEHGSLQTDECSSDEVSTATATAASEGEGGNGGTMVPSYRDSTTGHAEGSISITVTYCGVGSDRRAVEAWRKSMVLVSRAILEALSSLRSEADRMWLIVCIGLNQVAASIFTTCTCKHTQGQGQGEGQGERQRRFDFILDASQARLLTEVLSEEVHADWIVWGVMLAADCLFCSGEESHHFDKEIADNDACLQVEGEDATRIAASDTLDLMGLKASLLDYRARRDQMEATSATGPASASSSASVCAFLKDCHVTVTPSGSAAAQYVEMNLADLLALHRPNLIARTMDIDGDISFPR
jgi:hypothetical protein